MFIVACEMCHLHLFIFDWSKSVGYMKLKPTKTNTTVDYNIFMFPKTDSSSCTCVVALAVSLPITSLLSLLVGTLVAALVMWCWNKKSAVKTSADLTTIPPNPVYDEVSQDRGVNVQLTSNEAYGHVN